MRRMLWSALGFVTASLVGCPSIGPDYGVVVEDGDGDGWVGAEDCDDGAPAVHPDADELCDDGVDNDCDGAVDDDDVDCEEPDRPLWAGFSKAAAQMLGVWVGDTDSWVADYSGWGADRDGDGWSAEEDPDDHDPDVGGGVTQGSSR